MAQYEKHSVKIKKRIVENYIQLCCDKGIANVQLNDLCEACEIYRSTFYRYFDNLDSLLLYIEDDFMKKSAQIKSDAMRHPKEEYETRLYKDLLALFSEYRDFLLALFSPSGSARFTYRYKRFLRENLIDQLGLTNAALPLHIDLSLEYVVNGMVGTFSYLLRYSVQNQVSLADDPVIWFYFMKMQHLPEVVLSLINTNNDAFLRN